MFWPDLIVQALLDPEVVLAFTDAQWDLLIRQGRRTNLLGKLSYKLLFADRKIPTAPRTHLDSARKMADRQGDTIRWEVACIASALSASGIDFILLKGAAYVLAGLPISIGRTFSDVDILVPKDRISDVESALMIHGWQGLHHDTYDQRYYREWMHEIPPMLHVRRATTIDVHHTILPETARIQVNTKELFKEPVPVCGFDNVYVLKPVDMLLHSATHLFHEGELDNGLRDLFDLDSMFRHFSAENEFWSALLPRAQELGLERPLFYAVCFTRSILDTPVPEALVTALEKVAPPPVIRLLMTFCYGRALRPNHTSSHARGTWIARKALYIRSHWIRMPMFLLIRHLVHKALFKNKNDNLKASVKQNQA